VKHPLPKLPLVADGWLPTIVVDSREQDPLTFSFPTITDGLSTGDYSVAGLEDDFAIERKSLPDLVGSLTTGRDRFNRELQRLQAYSFKRLLIIGSEEEVAKGKWKHSKANPTAILHSLHSIEARGIPVAYASNTFLAASLVERWAFWRTRAAFKRVAQAINAHTDL
jgi:DNA excision repair protein ERCC-4